MTSIPVPVSHARAALAAWIRAAAPLLLFAAIGAELLVLVTWTPETLRVWADPERYGYGDFPAFYRNAQSFSLNAFYSPGLTVLMHPLTYFEMETAFRIYLAFNIAALAGVAFLAQRGVDSLPAKAAVVLGVLAVPQTHWALRVGHFTEVLAIGTLAGLLLCERRPVAGGIALGVLALKPQYLLVPLLYLAWTRNWRALATIGAGACALGIAGVMAMMLRDPAGPQMALYTLRYYAEKLPEVAAFLTVGQRDQGYAQGWQYSWYGFLVSAGVDRNPLIVADLMLVSAGALVAVWWRCSRSVAAAATVLGMLLLAPHTSFYNWSLLAVAGALLLRSDLRPRALVPVLIAGMAVAAASTQKATPFPLPYDAFRPATTYGLYWVQPAALAALIVLAVAGRRGEAPDATGETSVPRPLAGWLAAARTAIGPRAGALAAAACCAAVCGYLGAAWVSGSGPFAHDPYFGRQQVLGALPDDFPVPDDARLEGAGAGERLPYRVEWQVEARTSEVAGAMRHRLDGATWRLVPSNGATHAAPGTVELRSARTKPGEPSVIAEISVVPKGRSTLLRLEFSPLPASLVPGYEKWLESIGLVVHNVDPNSPAAAVTPAHGAN